jgi:hypothetical protein
MITTFFNSLLVFSFVVFPFYNEVSEPQQGKDSKWTWLFDGKDTNAWRGADLDHFPEKGWKIDGNELVVMGGDQSQRGGDIVTIKEYSSFDLMFEFKLSKGANSGLKYFAQTDPYVPGCEYQMIDDENNKDIKNDVDGKRLTAGLYELFEAENKKLKSFDKWNKGRILVEGKHVEHWLNGIKVLEYERGSEAFMEAKAKSKFKDQKDFGILESGLILLQDHHDKVYFRKIKIMEL